MRPTQTITVQSDGDPCVVDIFAPAHAAPPVLLLHGWGGSGRYWADLIARLGEHYTFIVPDLPGIGRSLPVRQTRDMFGLVDVVEAVLDRLGYDQVAVVGHSMGSGMALLLAERRPAQIERLVLTSISLFRSEAERRLFGAIVQVAEAAMLLRGEWMAELPFVARGSASRFFYRIPMGRDELLRDSFRDYLLMDRATAIASARSSTDPRIVAAARQVQVPALLVVTKEDQLMPAANVPFTAQTIPGCTVVWIAACGHLPMVERADEYAALVDGFLTAGTATTAAPAVPSLA